MFNFKLLPHFLYCASPRGGSRFICTGVVLQKQPLHDRLRSRRHRQEPRHRIPFVDEVALDHLPKKPMDIDGHWGSTDRKLKVRRFKDENRLKQLETTFDKIQELYHMEHNLWYHSLDLPLKCPEMLNFVQQLTRTNLHPITTNLDDQASPLLSNSLIQVLREQWVELNRFETSTKWDQHPKALDLRDADRSKRISATMDVLFQAYSHSNPTSDLFRRQSNVLLQTDERASVETFFKRFVPSHLLANLPEDNLDEDLYDVVDEPMFDSIESSVRYRIRSQLAWQLRCNKPLKPFVPWNNPDCKLPNYEPCNYRPESFDLHPVDCYSFSCLPHSNRLDFSEYARTVAGYWSHTPFWHGDPCEFGYLGVLDVSRGHQVDKFIKRTTLPDEVKHKVWINHCLSEGLLTAFAWTTAQAYNQGFTMYNELTYPIACQIILFDRNYIQLLRYQLNSTTASWKAEDSNLPYNMAWFSPKVSLFEFNETNAIPTLQLNPAALPLLLHTLAHPIDTERSVTSLRPYLAADLMKKSAQPTNRLIPNSADLAAERLGTSLAGTTPTITESERAALEAANRSDQKYPTRLYNVGRPHPNEVFFFKETDKSDLIQEMRDEYPDFGGQFGHLPEPYKSKLAELKLAMRRHKPRLRVQPLPRRWR